MARSLLSALATCLVVCSLPRFATSLGSTDTITWGGDNSRAGYETNHNLDPRVIASADFGNIWTAKLPGNFGGIGQEQVLSQPLVYTTGDGVQYVFVATTQNNLYKINARSGLIVASRNIGVPFLAADLGNCNDISPAIGVSGTGVIDASSGLWYLTSKTYTQQFQGTIFGPQSAPGRANGRYYFHAISTDDLSEAPNFPVSVHGTVFRNNPRRQLIAGDQHQRPALLQVGNFIYTGWASHCIQYNYTGAIIGFDKTSGTIVEAYAMEGGGEAITVAGGGVWMSGGGMAYDGAGSMFFSTGNGYAGQLPANGNPVSGRSPPTALEEAVVNMRINDDGTLRPIDFFMPWEKTQLDGADKDLGTTPFQLLPSSFTCANSRRIGMVTGKSGKTYWLDVDDLGGYQMGANRLDAAIQVFQHENSVYSAAGVQPLGGYIYVNVINFKTRVFQFSCNANGDATFTEVTTAAEKNAQALGVGHGTTTSIDGKEGTGLYWTTDVDGMDLRIYDATPPSDGSALKLIKGFNIDGPGKFAHPVFGDGRAYVGARGALWAFGAPVNLPLNCTSPIAFPRTAVNSTSAPITVKCTANVATSVTSFNLTGNPNFVASDLPALPLILATGNSFQFQARFTPVQVGFLSSDIVVNTTNAAAGSSSRTPVTLTGTASSVSALFGIQPITLTFNTTMGAGAVSKSVFWNNEGDAALNVTGILYSVISEQGPWITPNTTSDGRSQVAQFTFSNLPNSIGPNSRQSVGVIYDPPSAGNHAVFVKVSSTGGTKILDVFGTAGSQPVAVYEFEKADGSGWEPYVAGQNFSFGSVAPGTVRTLKLRITNNGSSTASPLGLTVSKPPFNVPDYVRASNSLDLAEGTQIAAGQSANATLYCAPPEAQLNTASTQASAGWRINTNNEQGAVMLGFVCTGESPQVGPLFSNGTAVNSYIGCYQDSTPNRQMASLIYVSSNNTAETCINRCSAAGYTFTATIFKTECWCGNAIPAVRGTEEDCNFRCSGDPNHDCGGNGAAQKSNMISLFADTTKWNGVVQGPAVSLPKTSGQYGFLGCYQENNAKTFNTRFQNSLNQTVDNCRTFCAGSALFGLQYAAECYCGSTIAGTSTQIADSLCDNTCKGNNSIVCGGSQKMQVYQLGFSPGSSTSTSLPSTTATVPTASSTSSPVVLVCPGSNGQTYVSNQKTFVVDCATDYQGADLKTVDVEAGSIVECIQACSSTLGCAGAVLSGAACYLKSDTSKPVPMNGEAGVRVVTTSASTTVSSTTTTSAISVTTSAVSSSTPAGSATSSVSISSGSATTSSATTSSGSLTTPSGTSSAITTSAVPSQTPLKCPDSNNQTYISNSQTFLIECGQDYPGNDMGSVSINDNDLNACIDACAKTVGCVNVSVMGAGCYLKNKMGSAVTNAAILGAKVLPAGTASTATSSTTTRAGISTTISVATSTGTSYMASTTLLATPTSTLSTSSATVSRSSSTPPATTTLTTASTRPSTTPSTTLSTSVSSVLPTTSTTTSSATIPSTTTSKAASTTVSATNSATPSTTSRTTTSLVTSTVRTTTTSSIMTTTSSMVTTTRATTTTTKATTTTSSRPTLQPTAGIYYSLGCTSEPSNSRALAELYTNTTHMTIDLCAAEARRRQFTFMGVEFGKECWMGDTLSPDALSLSQDKCLTPCPGDNTVACGGSRALQLSQVDSTLIEPKPTSPSPLSCPAGEDTVYTATNGSRFRIECGWDRNGGSSSMVTAATFEACLEACEAKTGCGSVALSGRNCYLKTGTLGSQYRNDAVRGATLVNK